MKIKSEHELIHSVAKSYTGEADQPCAMYFIVTIRSLIDTKTNSQDNYFQFFETTLNGIGKGEGSVLESFRMLK